MSQAERNTQKKESKPYLRIDNLTKMFGPFTALKDVDLEVYEGELVCFLGPSGCGKTTLLRCIAGLDLQTNGRIIQGGEDISVLPPSARDFGIVFQSYALFPNLTVRKNLAYGLENRRMKRAAIEKRVDELLELVGLVGQDDKYPSQLSGGQQQRVALTRALAAWPGLLLLDEPLSALDAKVRVHLRHEVRRLQRKLGITTIMVTHDQEEALTMADRVVVMDHGVIVQVGTPLQVYREPATSFVADFIGTMNFVPGTMAAPNTARFGNVNLVCDADGLTKGAKVTIAIRPEDIVVQGVAGNEENAFGVRIDSTEFLGSFLRVDLVSEAMGGARLRADLSINLVRRMDISEGASLPIMVPRESIRIYPGSLDHG